MVDAHADRDLILARLGEVWLKGRNRQSFLNRLERNLRAALKAELRGVRVEPSYGRIFIRVAAEDLHRALEICVDTPGLSSVSPARRVPSTVEAIREAALELTAEAWAGVEGTFSVKARRRLKAFPLTSPELGRVIGEAIGERFRHLSVDLKRSDHQLGIEVDDRYTHIWTRTLKGSGGLPVGSAGRVTLLLSGGIDSPVAGYLAQKRGCELDAVYFHSPPFIGEPSKDKVIQLANRLAPRQGGMRLYIIYFTEIQKAIRAACDPRFTVLLYRRFMYRLAAEIAEGRKALALCTGENLGQVASQTLENLTAVDRLTPLLTLRPVLAFDKEEIIEVARRIDTFDISTLPFDDCCTLFIPDNPIIHAQIKALEIEEAKLDVPALVQEALVKSEMLKLSGLPIVGEAVEG
ncbi:tRNA 4-thiouridine(8) synthase ThiI [Myxococcota bacterium]|nr:tRNA 4-thiouridine(8) synthase ThiI [Myxococcota bacterium]